MYHLLIVDDEESVLDSLTLTIPWEDYGIEGVHRALSGREALELIGRRTIHIMIADIRMPGMNGLELIDKVRQVSAKTKCIVLTGYAEFEYAQEAIRHQATQYLLKPIDIDRLIMCVREVIETLRLEWAQISSYEQALSTLKDNLPVLRNRLLYDLIRGVRLSPAALSNKMKLLDIPVGRGDDVFIMLIRMEDEYSGFDPNSLMLFEYAIENIAHESLGHQFELWKCKDDYDYIVFLIRPKHPEPIETVRSSAAVEHNLEQSAIQLQNNIHTFLKGSVSILVSHKGMFPDEVPSLHQASASVLSHRLGKEGGLFMTSSDALHQVPVHSLQHLYEPPLLIHLLEAGNWEQAERKLELIFAELHTCWSESQEHVTEVFFHIHSCFSCIVHRRGLMLVDLLGELAGKFAGKPFIVSVHQLQEWCIQMLAGIKVNKEQEIQHFRAAVVRQVHEFIQLQDTLHVSVQSIADHVHLHPVYLSKIYKQETGTTLGEYLFGIRMEKAVYMLHYTNDKIYEICTKLGYQNVPHFIKLFKTRYGMTPQEYRNEFRKTHPAFD